jgi:hypothetical protein
VSELLRPNNPLLAHMAAQSHSLARADASAQIAQAVLDLYNGRNRNVTLMPGRHLLKKKPTLKDWMGGLYDHR